MPPGSRDNGLLEPPLNGGELAYLGLNAKDLSFTLSSKNPTLLKLGKAERTTYRNAIPAMK